MATGVHQAGNLRTIRDFVDFLNGKRVHIHPQGDDGRVGVGDQIGYQAVTAHAGADCETQKGELVREEGCRPGFVAGELRMTVQVAAG